MFEEIIPVAKRDTTGKSASRGLRNNGLIPAVIYGLNEPPVAVAISPKVVARIIASDTGLNTMVHLQREGTDIKRHVIIKEVQRHPVTGRLSHVDFMRVDPSHKVRVKIPIHLQGIPIGVKEGGILDFTHREIEVECLPSFIPPHVDVNVEHLKVNDSMRLDQVVLDAHLTLHGDAHNVICSVKGKKADEEEIAAEAAAAEAAATAAAAAAAAAAPAPAAPAGKGKK
jgi:large subunit ribosomal protein L25